MLHEKVADPRAAVRRPHTRRQPAQRPVPANSTRLTRNNVVPVKCSTRVPHRLCSRR